MARIFITGSADGLGSLAAQQLIADGHEVVLHARNSERAEDARRAAPGAQDVLVADLSDIEAVKQLAADVNDAGPFDAVIHNAGIYEADPEQIFAINSLAPYVLTALMDKPKRLIYLSSGMHKNGTLDTEDIMHTTSYGDSKLQVLMLAKIMARLNPDIYANAVDPGWVPTKMGGPDATDNLDAGAATQVWLASSDDPAALVSGKYFFHQSEADYSEQADNRELQDAYVAQCEQISGVKLLT